MAGIREGSRVLDVAAGAGGQSLTAARRAGDGGSVLATDISPNLLDFAASRAREAGLSNVDTAVLDGEQLDVEAGSFDAVISRVGFIYFPDQQAALRGMRRALAPGGKLAGIVYSTALANQFFSIPVSIIRRRAELPPPAARAARPVQLRRTRRDRGRLRASRFHRHRDPPDERTAAAVARRRSACAFSRSPSAPCIRCSPASPKPAAPRRGARSRPSSDGSRARTASKDPANS